MKGLNEIIGGYALIKSDATKFITSGKITDFQDKIVRVMEFAEDGGALCVNNEATHMAMVEKEEIKASFKCIDHANVLCPPHMPTTEQMIYYLKVITRKGGYNNIVRNMVIAASLHKGEFTDSVLFSKQ